MPGRRVIAGPAVVGTNLTADRSVTFSENVIPVHGSAVRRIHTQLAGTNFTLANITRISLKASQQPVIDVKPSHLQAILGYFAKRDVAPNTDTGFTLPLDLFGGGAPAGKLLRLEIEKNANPGGNPTAMMIEEIDDTTPASGFFYALGSSQPLNANDSQRPLSIPTTGTLVGIVVPDVFDITLLRVKQSGQVVQEFTVGTLISRFAKIERGYDPIAGEPCYVPTPPLPIVPGSTVIEVSAGSGYTADDWTFVSVAA